MKKKEGDIQDFILQMIGIVICFIMMLCGIDYADTVIKYNDANEIARKYILRMEAKGYLASDDQAELESDMDDKGFSNISLANSTTTQVHYGEEVKLVINFQETVKAFKLENFKLEVTNDNKNLTITKASTALYFNEDGN